MKGFISFICFDFPSIRRIALIYRRMSSMELIHHATESFLPAFGFLVPDTVSGLVEPGKEPPGDLDHPRSTKIHMTSTPQRWSTMASPSSDSGRRLGRANTVWFRRVDMSMVYPCIAQLEITYHMMPLAENYFIK